MGVLGMSRTDFCRLTPRQLELAITARMNDVEQGERTWWERIRMAVTMIIQPHIRQKITPQKLLPFPWDGIAKKNQNKPAVSRESAHRRFLELTKRKK